MTSQRMMARFGRWVPAILLAFVAAVNGAAVEAAGYTWSGSGSNALWGTGGNWQGGSAPVSGTSSTTLVFTGTTQTSSTNATSLFGVSQLRFANPPQTFTKTFSWSGTGNDNGSPSYNQAFSGAGSFTYTPSLAIGGTVPRLVNPAPGCRFAPRCRFAQPECLAATPALREVAPGHRVACIL